MNLFVWVEHCAAIFVLFATICCRVLDNNFITEVSGLEQNIKLRELYVSYQKLPDNTPLTFTESTLQSIGVRIQNIKGSNANAHHEW